ncbi:MAG: hypothetical protein ACTHKF_00380 [Candidatus Nitrosocosmicus sp.]
MSSSSSNGNFNSNDKSKKKIDKKGVVITLIIVVGIVGASFIVWFLPQGINQNNGNNNGNNEMIFSNPNDTLVAVSNQFMLLKNELNNQTNSGNNIFSRSNISSSSLSQLKSSIDASIKQNNGLMQSLLHGNPSGALVPNYVNMMNKLKNFSFYLDDLKNMISSAPALTASTTSSKNLTKDLILLQNKWSIR